MTVRVVVCAKQAITREGLRTMLGEAPDVSVVSLASDGRGSLAAWRATRSDLVVLDLPEARDELSDAIRLFRADGAARSPVIAVCHDRRPATTSALLDSGACGVLADDVEATEMALAVRTAAQGELYLTPRLVSGLIDWLRAGAASVEHDLKPRTASLTPREREVLVTLAGGKSLEDTAKALFISNATVRTHVYRIRHKLRARDRAELVSLAFRAGMVRSAELV
ncbi:MAG TPA: response regulator transcription factor [Jatrophihabitans sp.]|jgi:DNA-binding NarL/FixJ family response regulator|uniref:response regulator transcription factor n=1 Tax=Jatrophihabitans sp. TaxID=1932789 RepID=UPI002EDEA57E